MQTSSIFHFFTRLMERRGYFVQENKLEDFAFPESIIAAKSTSGFPDFVLKTNQGNLLTGGELIELKDAKSNRLCICGEISVNTLFSCGTQKELRSVRCLVV